MPYRFMENKWFIRTIYILVLFSLIALMGSTYFIDHSFLFTIFKIDVNLSFLPFMLIGGLFGYFLALNSYLILFIIAVFLSSMDAYLLTPYMIITYAFSMFAQYRWFRTKGKTIKAFLYSYLICLFFEALNKDYMIKYDFEVGHMSELLNHASSPIFSCFIGCLFFYLFFNYAPDCLKSIFPIGYMYTREYVENLLFQNSLKKTRLSVKITAIIIFEAVILGFFSIVFIRILFPDLRHMLNEGVLEAKRVGDDMIFRYNNYGIAFTIKMLFMELSIAVPVASNINFYAKMKIGSPIGQLSNYMLKFTDTTDENRTNYLQTIKSEPLNTHDEITDLYYSMMITLNEITGYIERIQEEQKLEENLRVAEAASEAKSSFLSNMSHEIRTPINAVLGMNEMILRESAEPQTLEYAATIQSAGNTLLSLVNDILDFSKIEAGKMEILPVQYNLSSVINDLVNMIMRRANDKNLELKVVVDENIPDLLYGDEIRIKQCATNILTNAVKYTEKGSVTLDISFERLEGESAVSDSISYGSGSFTSEKNTTATEIPAVQNNQNSTSPFKGKIALKIRVIDTGIGIKEEDLHKLYSPFERIEEIRNRTIEGTGLGMSIVKKLLAMMDTRLVVESVYGKGSDFSFTVVQQVCDWEPIGDFEKRYRETLSSRKKYHESFTAPAAKILVVDDTSMNLIVIKGLLKKTLIQISTATSGREALGLVTREKFDLIFLDHRMPDMDGIETLEAMKKLEGNLNSDTLCIALTANAVAGAREFYLDAGFKDYLSKPIDAARLENMLAAYLPADKVKVFDASKYDSENDSAESVHNNSHDNDASKQNYAEESNNINVDYSEISMGEAIKNDFSGMVMGKENNNSFFGINMEEAIKNCGDEATALEVIGNFKENLPDKFSAIRDYEASGDIKNFTIQVHSLKSSARIIGAGKLSEQAAELEGLGNEWIENKNSIAELDEYSTNDSNLIEDKIHSLTSSLLDMLKKYMEYWGISDDSFDASSSSNSDVPSADSKPLISMEELDSALSDIRELMQAFDYDNASEIYKMLADYTIPPERLEKYKLVGKYIASVDREKLLELL